MQLSECELGSSINGNEEIKLALCCLHLSDVDMKVTDGVALEALPDRAIPCTSGSREIPCRCKQRCKDERVK